MRKQLIIIVLIAFLIPLGKEALFKHYRLSFNFTKSISGNLFLYEVDNNAKFSTGDLVVFKVRSDDIYYPDKQFLKIVAGKSGDYLKIQGRTYLINNYQVTAKERGLTGNDLKQFLPVKNMNNIIPDNNYFVIGSSKHSYDSRYFGFITKEQIIGKAWRIF